MPRAPRLRSFLASLFGFLAVLPFPGCAGEELSIESSPPGALLFLDGEEVGVADEALLLRVDTWGTRRAAAYWPGGGHDEAFVEVRPPWYAWVPFDLVTGLPWGGSARRHEVLLRRRPEGMQEREALRSRAEALRAEAPPRTP